jgi:fructose-1,6-bisphosphatase
MTKYTRIPSPKFLTVNFGEIDEVLEALKANFNIAMDDNDGKAILAYSVALGTISSVADDLGTMLDRLGGAGEVVDTFEEVVGIVAGGN